MEMYDDYGQPDIFSSLTNPEHALQSPNAVLLSATQNNMFMYEQEHNTSTTTSSRQDLAAKLSHSDNIFEFPNPEEMAELGCDPLMESCWPETPLLAGSLDGSLNDSGMYFGWDLSEDDQEALLQSGAGPLISAPTLTQLNMEESKDKVLGLKRKHDGEDESKDTTLTKVLQGQQEMSLSPQSWKRVKTEAAEMARGDPPKSLVTRLANPKHSLAARKASRTKPTRLIAPKSGARTQNEASKSLVKTEKSSGLTLAKVHPSKIDFTELFWKRYRRSESIPSPTREMSRSEFIARTPNPFGNRRFLGRNALLKSKNHHHNTPPKVTAPIKTVSKSVLSKSNQKPKSKKPSPIRKLNLSPATTASDESSQDKLWKELEEYMYGEQKLREGKKKDAPHRTLLLTEPDLKSESSKSPRTNVSSDPGFDSHDEGLGSENEDHDDSGSDDDDDDDDDDIQDDVSDMSDDPGLPSTSTKCPGSSSKTSEASRSKRRRRRVKTRRSEYDDFTPNPRKLLHIGHELNKLNMTISSLSPGGEASNEEKNHTRREKNKLASRACRLKKKAQHEANKVKLWGLAEEAKQLKIVLKAMRKEMSTRAKKPKASWDYALGAQLDHLIKSKLGHMVAGHTSEFVNSVLEKTAKGIPVSRLNTKVTKLT